MKEFMLPCLNKMLFGIECPGCGGQRALVMVFQGKFAAAFQLYPAIYPILALFIFLVFNLFVKFKYQWHVKAGLIVVSATVVIVAYISKFNFIF